MRALTLSINKANHYFINMMVAVPILSIHLISPVQVSPVWAERTVQSSTNMDTISKKPPSRKPHKLIRKSESTKQATITPATPSTAYQTSMIPLATVAAPISDAPAKEEQIIGPTGGRGSVSTLQSGAGTTQTSSSSLIGAVTSAPSPTTSATSSGLTASPSTGAAFIGSSASSRLGRLLSEMPGLAQLGAPYARTSTTTSPILGMSPTSLSFTAQQGGGNPATQSVTISNTGGGTLTWSASDNGTWLSVGPATGTGNGSVTATVATGALTAGTYSAAITISANGAAPVSVPVTFTVTPASSAITLSPTALTFTAVQGSSNLANQSVGITSNGSWTATSNAAWLTVSPSSGSGSGSLTVGINLSAITVGPNTATITVTGGGTTRTATVTLTTTAASLTASPGSLTYMATQGAANPASQSITVTSNVSWTVSDNASWLVVNTTSGSNNATITATVNTSNMAAGSHTATITLTAGGITRTINVALTLNLPATSSATLTWTANTEPDLASYRIYRSTTAGVYGAALATVQAGTVNYQDYGLQLGTTYYFTITAVDSAGNESARSNEVSKSIF